MPWLASALTNAAGRPSTPYANRRPKPGSAHIHTHTDILEHCSEPTNSANVRSARPIAKWNASKSSKRSDKQSHYQASRHNYEASLFSLRHPLRLLMPAHSARTRCAHFSRRQERRAALPAVHSENSDCECVPAQYSQNNNVGTTRHSRVCCHRALMAALTNQQQVQQKHQQQQPLPLTLHINMFGQDASARLNATHQSHFQFLQTR